MQIGELGQNVNLKKVVLLEGRREILRETVLDQANKAFSE